MRLSFAVLGLLCVLGTAMGCRRSERGGEAQATVQTSASASATPATHTGPLTIAYSDWPGWVAWDIAVKKGWFKEEGVEVSFVWLEYVPSMEAFSEGKVDAVCMTNGDALVAGSSGALGVGIVINDFSNGNDMVVAQAGIEKLTDLRGKKVGVEVGFVDHLLLMEGLKTVNMSESDVQIVGAKTHETPELLKAGGVAAIAAWQPNSGYALELVPGSKAIFSSADVPGLIYDLLFVSKRRLAPRRADWQKVIKVWFRVAAFVNDPAHRSEAAQIMSVRSKLSPEKYAKLMDGTRFLDKAENQKRFRKTAGFDSVQGSSAIVDKFNVANHVYKESTAVDPYFDASLASEL